MTTKDTGHRESPLHSSSDDLEVISSLGAARPSGRAAIVFRPERRLDVGSALLLTAPLDRLAADRFPRTVLLMDFGCAGLRSSSTGLTDACLDRLACLPAGTPFDLVVATHVPALARLAAAVATSVRVDDREASDSRNAFREILLAAGLLATRATHVAVEAGGPADLVLTRRIARGVERVLPGESAFPVPLGPGFYPFRALDGSGPMGSSEKGTLFVSDSPDAVARKVRVAKTDAGSHLDPGADLSPEVANLLLLLQALSDEPMTRILDRHAGRGYCALKSSLAEAAVAFLAPIQARRAALLADETALRARLDAGARRLEARSNALADALLRSPEFLAA